ncbi:MAG TPA: hypothetical protein VIU12_20200 [Chryseolinea sp.]
MKQFERWSLVLLVGGIVMEHVMGLVGSITFIMSIVLSIFYFILGPFYFNGIALPDIFQKSAYAHTSFLRFIGAFGAGSTLSTLVVSAIFSLFNYTGGRELFLIGAFSGLVILVVSLIRYLKSKDPFYMLIVTRLTLLMVLNVVILLV